MTVDWHVLLCSTQTHVLLSQTNYNSAEKEVFGSTKTFPRLVCAVFAAETFSAVWYYLKLSKFCYIWNFWDCELALAAENGPLLDFFRQEQAGKAAHGISAAVGGSPLHLAVYYIQGLVTQCIDANPSLNKNSVSSFQEMNQTS